MPEIQHLLVHLYLRPTEPPDEVLAWSLWRRKHQARARRYHYRTRAKRKDHDVQL